MYRVRSLEERAKTRPLWADEAERRMRARGLSKKMLADKLKVNYSALCAAIAGLQVNQKLETAVKTFLDMEVR